MSNAYLYYRSRKAASSAPGTSPSPGTGPAAAAGSQPFSAANPAAAMPNFNVALKGFSGGPVAKVPMGGLAAQPAVSTQPNPIQTPATGSGPVVMNGMLLSPQEAINAQAVQAEQAAAADKSTPKAAPAPDSTNSDTVVAALRGQMAGIKTAADFSAGQLFDPSKPGQLSTSGWTSLTNSRAMIDSKKHPILSGIYNFVRPVIMSPLLQRYKSRGLVGDLENRAHKPFVQQFVKNLSDAPLASADANPLQTLAMNYFQKALAEQ